MRKHRIWYCLMLAFAIIFYLISDSSATVILLAGLIIIPLISGILLFVSTRSIHLKCNIKESTYAGTEQFLEIRMEKSNRVSMGALVLETEVKNVLYGDKEKKLLVLQPVKKKEQLFCYKMELNDCGQTKIHISRVHFYDLTGLFAIRKNVHLQTEILVYPPELKLNIQKQRRPEVETMGELYDPQRKGQDVNEVSRLRAYVEGDSLGSIHWKLSGKLDELIVREFGYPSNYHTILICDLMKKDGDRECEKEQNNVILSLMTSLSRSMLEANMEHVVVKVEGGNCQPVSVNTMADHDAMVLEMLCCPIEEKKVGGDTLYHFLRSNLLSLCTKMVYITSDFDSEEASLIARELDLTIIRVGMESSAGYTDMNGYSVLPIQVKDDYADKLQTVVI